MRDCYSPCHEGPAALLSVRQPFYDYEHPNGQKMKKIFTVDDIMVAFIASLGYGFSETISRLLGWPEVICMAVSVVIGIAFEETISKIVFSETVQRKPLHRFFVYGTFFLIFLIAQYISVSQLGVSMFDYLGQQVVSVILFPVLGFIVNLIIRAFRARKIRKLYGDGSGGYVFDVKNEDIEEINKQNHAVTGEYDADLAVKTKNGIYVGEKQKGFITYLGIPYAKPPVGELRWKAPEPLPASDAVFEAKNFGASAIQVEHKGVIIKHHRQSEDCLSLNICVGKHKTETPKPVLVLFHNGDFSYGGSVDPLMYSGNFINKHQDIITVSFNYRLGIFGFIDFSDVPGGEAYPDAINLGLLDQIAALKWIKENIAAFGGDPDRITVLGFESGASSICLLAASERARGLFQKAFVFFGCPDSAYVTTESSRALAGDLMREAQTKSMKELMQLGTDALKDASQKLWQNMCAPTCDGSWIPADVYRAYQEGAASGIEFIIGIPGNERQVLRSVIGDQKYEDLMSAGAADIQNYMNASADNEVQAYIQTQMASSDELEEKSKLVEHWMALCMYRTAAKLSEGGNKVHLMYWNEKPLIEKLGSGSVDAAAALLGNSEAAELYGSMINEDLSLVLQVFLQKFINGDELQLYPNEIRGVDGIDWKGFPLALIMSEGNIQCDMIEDRFKEVKGLFDLMVK